MSDDAFHVNKACVYLEEAQRKLELAVDELEASSTINIAEDNTLSRRTAMIYNELRNIHQEIAKKRA